MKKYRYIYTALLALLLSAAAYAQTQEEQAGAQGTAAETEGAAPVIVVSGSKIEENQEDAVEKVQVVSGEEIRETGAKTLTEAVRNLPGVVVQGNNPAQHTDAISMQGFDSSYVKILVDGVAVTADIGGATAVYQVPVEDIDHIEIIQGASSALYGSDAMGGVINIITKKPELSDGEGITFKGSVTQEFSSNIRTYTAANMSMATKRTAASLSGSFDWKKGKEETYFEPFTQSDISYYLTARRRLGFVRGTFDYNFDAARLGVYGLFSDSLQKSNYTPNGLDKTAVMTYKATRAEGGINGDIHVGDTLTFSGFSSVKVFDLNTDYPQKNASDNIMNFEANETDSNAIDWESEIRAAWDPNLYNSVLFGINANLQTIDGDSFENRKKQVLLSAFAQDTISLFDETFSIVPGVRMDFSPPVDGADLLWQITPKLSMRYDPAEDTVLRLSYGMGYKVPTLKQKYWLFYHNYGSGDANFILDGNPDLKPEKSQSVNISVEQKIAGILTLGAGGYFNYVNDLIDSYVYDTTSQPQRRTYRNIDTALTFGGDVSLSVKADRFDGKIGYAYTAAKQYNESDGSFTDLTLRVPHRITAHAGYTIPVIEVKVSLSGEWNAPQLMNAEEKTYTPDYLMLGLNIDKDFWDGKFSLYGRIDNLLNNIHFIDASNGDSQKDYFALHDGITATIGGRLAL